MPAIPLLQKACIELYEVVFVNRNATVLYLINLRPSGNWVHKPSNTEHKDLNLISDIASLVQIREKLKAAELPILSFL